MTDVILATILARGDTADAWTAENPVLKLCEMGVETDTLKFKFGDGVSDWDTLEYAAGGGSDVIAALGEVTVTAGQVIYFTAADAASVFDTTAFARGLMASANAAAFLTALGIDDHESRIAALESSQSTQDSRLNALETSDSGQDTQLTDHESRITALETP